MVLSWVAVPSGLTCKQIALRALPVHPASPHGLWPRLYHHASYYRYFNYALRWTDDKRRSQGTLCISAGDSQGNEAGRAHAATFIHWSSKPNRAQWAEPFNFPGEGCNGPAHRIVELDTRS